MSKADLQGWLIDRPGFHQKFEGILVDSVAAQFPNLEKASSEVTGVDWSYLLFCASIFADSPRSDCQDAALRIAQACITNATTTAEEKDTATIVLDDLANRLAIELSTRRGLVKPNLPSRLGTLSRIEWTRRSIENSIVLADDSIIQTNRFQRRFWQAVKNNKWTSTSAPTSAGKSFIVLEALGDLFRRRENCTAIYVVPTRALIHQVETDFRSLRAKRDLNDVSVSSIPLAALLRPQGKNFFVFTQERLHLFLSAFETTPHIDAIIIDEAQKVGDGARGVLLQDVIERVTTTDPDLQIIFASPQTRNPEALLSDAPSGASKSAVKSDDITVNQNLIWASQVPRKPKVWNISLCLPEERHEIGTVNLPFSPSVSKRLPFVAYALGAAGGGNLIYVNGAADAENVARLLFDLVGSEGDLSANKAIQDLAELIKNAIHDQYVLAQVIQRGIAFHYGNMPLIVRTEIERCFREGHLKFLVCTSTLIEGVNLPCRNIFIRGPKKGRNTPMNEEDFWNLAGRAGRWGQEFQGNVVCVDPTNEHVWRNGAPQVRSQYKIERATDKALLQHELILDFLRAGMPAEKISGQPQLEYIGSYLVASTLRSGSIANTPFGSRLDPQVLAELESAIMGLIDVLEVGPQVILRNPGISPVAINQLLTYFSNREGSPEELLPVSPVSEDAVQHFVEIFGRINREVSSVFGPPGRAFALAMLVVSWMRGYPLKRLITERWAYLSQRGTTKMLSAVIREVMKDVEEIARFQAPKYLACYIDVLKQHLTTIERTDLITSDLDINILLEFGVPGGTQLSLMGLGMSRTSALALAEFIASDELTESQAITWLRENDWRTLNLPNLVKVEIESVLRLVA
jgi:hypothetical protein